MLKSKFYNKNNCRDKYICYEKGGCNCSRQNNEKGFIALTSISLMSAFFVVLFSGMFFSATEGMERSLDRERSLRALSKANTCAEIALDELRLDDEYSGDEVVNVGDGSCEIKPIDEYGLDGKAVKAQAEVRGQTKKIQVESNIEDWPAINVIDWTEVGQFTEFEDEEEEEE